MSLVKIVLLLILLLLIFALIFNKNIFNLLENKSTIVIIKENNNKYKFKPIEADGKIFSGENLEVYEVTRDKGLSRTVKENQNIPSDKINKVNKIKSFYIQLYSYKNSDIALEKLQEYENSPIKEISNLNFSISEIDIIGKGIFYRLRTGPFASLKNAYDTCMIFKIQKTKCLILEDVLNN